MSTEIAKNNNMTMEKIHSYLQAMNMAQNLSKSEVQQFVEIAQAYGLNPFKREIYVSKFGNNFSIIVGFETYLKRAERSGKLAGWSVTTTGKINWSSIRESDMVAIITIHRKDWTEPFVHSVHFSEYVQLKGDGTPNKFWKEKGITMIKKVAMAQGFRLCFPDENGGLPYTSEEIGAEQNYAPEIIDTSAEIVESGSVSAPAKRGRPKKDALAPAKLNEWTMAINSCKALDELKTIWDNIENITNYPELIELFKNKKAQLVLMNEIKEAKDADAIWALVENVKDQELLAFAKNRIDELSEKPVTNELF